MDMKYGDAVVRIDAKKHPPILQGCVRYMPGSTDKVIEYWTFSGATFLGSVPVSKESVHVLYGPKSVHFEESKPLTNPNGSISFTYSYRVDQASPIIVDRKTSYTLVDAAAKALPADDYALESYLPEKCVIEDMRKDLSISADDNQADKPTVYYYEAKNGTIDDQTRAIRDKVMKIQGQAVH
jgi:hypothetical protein